MTMLKAVLAKMLLLTVSLLLTVNVANAGNELTQQLKIVGKGEMSWLFIDLYQASLYSPTGEYQQRVYPQALKIVYQQDIDRDDLVNATEKEWQKLSQKQFQKQSQKQALDASQYQDWLVALRQLWPDIKEGEDLLFIVEADGRGVFYHNDQLLGGINSNEFSEAFLSIWLSKNTSEPGLRRQLIGE